MFIGDREVLAMPRKIDTGGSTVMKPSAAKVDVKIWAGAI
jgi:hypothetical protein